MFWLNIFFYEKNFKILSQTYKIIRIKDFPEFVVIGLVWVLLFQLHLSWVTFNNLLFGTWIMRGNLVALL